MATLTVIFFFISDHYIVMTYAIIENLYFIIGLVG